VGRDGDERYGDEAGMGTMLKIVVERGWVWG